MPAPAGLDGHPDQLQLAQNMPRADDLEQASMRMRVEAGRARTRTSVRVIVGTALGFAVLVVLLNRAYLSAFDTVTGQIVLLDIGVVFGLGSRGSRASRRLPSPTASSP